LKRFSAVLFAFAVFAANHAGAQTTASTLSPEQDRAALIQALQKRLPGTRPEDWVTGGTAFEPGVTAIPLSAENATNTADILSIGKKRWEQKFKDGKSFSNCFPNGGKRMAANYPQFEQSTKQVVTIETALNRCLQLHGETTIQPSNAAEMGPLSAYARSLSENQPLNVRVLGQGARDRFDAGHRFCLRIVPCAACRWCVWCRRFGACRGASRVVAARSTGRHHPQPPSPVPALLPAQWCRAVFGRIRRIQQS
jgi:hypothetical protein